MLKLNAHIKIKLTRLLIKSVHESHFPVALSRDHLVWKWPPKNVLQLPHAFRYRTFCKALQCILLYKAVEQIVSSQDYQAIELF